MKNSLNEKFNNFEIAIFLFLVLGFIIFHVLTLKNGHNWGGDFSQYIQQALHITNPQQYPVSYDLEPWKNYPWGFPALLAPIINFFGVNFLLLKIPNIIYWLIYVFGIFFISRRYFDKNLSILTSFLLLTSPYFFVFKQNIISDLPFLAVSTWAIFCFVIFFEDIKDAGRSKCFVYGLILVLLSCLIRYPGFILLIALGVLLILKRKYKLFLYAICGGAFVALLLLWGDSGPESYKQEFFKQDRYSFVGFVEQLDYLLKSLVIFFLPFKTLFTVKFFSIMNFFIILTASFVGVYLYDCFSRRKIDFIAIYLLLNVFLLLVWSVRQGVRYVLPMTGLMLLINLKGVIIFIESVIRNNKMQKISIFLTKFILLFLIWHNIICIASNIGFNDDVINSASVREAVDWTKTHTERSDRFMIFRPRVWGLLTQRQSINVIQFENSDDVLERIRKYKLNYLLLLKDDARPLNKLVALNNPDDSLSQLTNPNLINVESGQLYMIKKFKLEQCFELKLAFENDYIVIYKLKNLEKSINL